MVERPEVEDHFMRDAAVVIRVEHVIVILQTRLEIIRVQDGVARRVGHSCGTQHADVSVRDQQNARAAPRSGGYGGDRPRAPPPDGGGAPEKTSQMLLHTHY